MHQDAAAWPGATSVPLCVRAHLPTAATCTRSPNVSRYTPLDQGARQGGHLHSELGFPSLPHLPGSACPAPPSPPLSLTLATRSVPPISPRCHWQGWRPDTDPDPDRLDLNCAPQWPCTSAGGPRGDVTFLLLATLPLPSPLPGRGREGLCTPLITSAPLTALPSLLPG